LDSDSSVMINNSVMQVHKITFIHWGVNLDQNASRYSQQFKRNLQCYSNLLQYERCRRLQWQRSQRHRDELLTLLMFIVLHEVLVENSCIVRRM